MDDKSKTGGQDRTRVNTGEDYEMQYWSEKFGCSQEELKQAVKAVGSEADKVEEYLSSR